MFKVSFQISDSKLAEALGSLNGIAPVEVRQIDAALPPVTMPKKRGPYRKKQHQHQLMSGTIATPRASMPKAEAADPRPSPVYDKVRQVLSEYGVGPFNSTELIARVEGVPGPTVYRVLRQEVLAGNIKKLGPGRYQKTGASWISALGTASS